MDTSFIHLLDDLDQEIVLLIETLTIYLSAY